jgi:hypothetical protein
MPSAKSLSAILHSASGLTRMHDENEGCVLMLCDVWEPKQRFLPGYAASKMLCSSLLSRLAMRVPATCLFYKGYAGRVPWFRSRCADVLLANNYSYVYAFC